MSELPDLDIRYGRGKHLWPVCVGVLGCGIGLYQLVVHKDLVGLVPFFIGAGLGLWSTRSLLDRSVKLSLTAGGLKDHRTGMSIRWADVRGVRLHSVHGKYSLVSATLYIKVPDAEGEKELPLDVKGLERDPNDIARLVEERGAPAPPQRSADRLPGGTGAGSSATGEQLDLDLRYDPGKRAGLPILGGLLCGGIGLYEYFARGGFFGLLLLLLGAGLIVYGAVTLFDRSVKLSLTSEGLSDHRTGVFIRWADVRAVRLSTASLRYQTSAALYVAVADDGGEREVAVDVADLDRAPDDIAGLVRRRGWRLAKERNVGRTSCSRPATQLSVLHG
jgi:hypothetical protein